MGVRRLAAHCSSAFDIRGSMFGTFRVLDPAFGNANRERGIRNLRTSNFEARTSN